MKLSDTVWGVLLFALSAAVLWNIQSFPRIPGQDIGPSAFPGLLAVILAGCAVALIVRGLRAREAPIAIGAWTRSRHHATNFLVTAAALLVYIGVVDKLGFLVTGTLILFALLLKLRTRAMIAATISVLVVLVIHLIFYKMLRVTLPWGILPVLY
jgi:putative tricarboxylic transport membrane protein